VIQAGSPTSWPNAGPVTKPRCARFLSGISRRSLESQGKNATADKLLDAVQEGNAALVDSIAAFRGTTATEFFEEMRAAVADRVSTYLDTT
jgi:hypothetical protein